MSVKKEKRSLGETLVDEGVITREQLEQAKIEEKKSGERLCKILVKRGLITEEELVTFLSARHELPRIELANYLIDPKVIELVSEELARKYEVIPVLKIGSRLTCAMVDPWNVFALDEIRMKTGLIIEPAVATEKEIKRALDQYYGSKGTMEELIETIDEKKLDFGGEEEIELKKLEGIAEEPIVIKLVNLTIIKAVKSGASDIHIEPEEKRTRIRFRIDGILHEVPSPPKYLQSAIISRIKIMANLNIAERRMPQDGRFSMKMEGRDIDVRVSCMPTIYGENVVLRLLDVANAILDLKDLGFSKYVLERFEELISHPHGIILVTGPTGSGKTTTLYAALDKINTVDKNIITIEDPVEYKLSGVRQIQVNPRVGLTFANGLRSILRQDPDIIMVGEMRDYETAEIAIQAAMTGHLVFSTLHTNDASSAITRMIEMGIEPYLIASSVIGVLAQRLVRRICNNCKEKYSPSKAHLMDSGFMEDTEDDRCSSIFYRGKGCPKCMNTGYRGRTGVFELMTIDSKIRDLILARASLEDIKKHAVECGMGPLKQDGVRKVRDGVTTIDEVLRVLQRE